jgi:hypothetical protein
MKLSPSRDRLRRWVENPTVRLFILLVLTDLAFFAIHFGYAPEGLLDDPRFRLDWDRGYAETFQYLKELWIVLLLLYLALRDRALLYFGFAGFFAYLGLDDLWRIHERLGGSVLGARLPDLTLFGRLFSGYNLGQTLYAVVVGLAVFALVMLVYRRARPSVQRTARTLLLLLVALAYFGIVFDILNALVLGGAFETFFIFAEEAGEHLIMTTIFGYLFVLGGPRVPAPKKVGVHAEAA